MTGKWMVVLLGAALAACATTTTDVVTVGPGLYMVGARSGTGFTTDVELKTLAVKKAGDYCAAKGLVPKIEGADASGIQFWSTQNSEVRFSCVPRTQ